MYVCMYKYYLSQHENFGHIEIILHFDAEQNQFEYSAMQKSNWSELTWIWFSTIPMALHPKIIFAFVTELHQMIGMLKMWNNVKIMGILLKLWEYC